MKATSFSSSISANMGNSGEAMVEIHKYWYLWPPHFHTFCELVEGEENKTNYILHMDYNVRVQ